ncbi:magnesium chelatase family protein [Parafrankia irregularis]|uniref:Magnesium chelatase family protein n=2 Tax=Frankiaceae TaxID=74712 RepID=A0A0S4R2M1_9ACTN|nr:magnesium chelatase family protein [Parafrankia irregularis]
MGLIGLPESDGNEMRDRTRAAVINSGFQWPDARITVGLFPATLPKFGSAFDVAIAAAILASAGQVPTSSLSGRVLLGELALDGRIRPVSGVLPAVQAAVEAGFLRVVVPSANASEAALVSGVVVEPVPDLRHVIDLLRGDRLPLPVEPIDLVPATSLESGHDLANITWRTPGRQAVEIAAAGGHHLFLQGPHGTGKVMLAESIPGLLPPLEEATSLEVTAIHSAAGLLSANSPVVTRPPYRSPHHSATPAGLLGAGRSVLRPGLMSQAHRGVLFLNDAPEFGRPSLDILRHSLETGLVGIARGSATIKFPARFILVLAAKPCPCSQTRDNNSESEICTCPAQIKRRYLARLGTLLDRIDIKVELPQLTPADLRASHDPVESTAVVAARVARAREAMALRLRGTPWRINSEIPAHVLERQWPLSTAVRQEAERLYEIGALTRRGVNRVFRLAWTLADLADIDRPGPDQIKQAIALQIPGRPA